MVVFDNSIFCLTLHPDAKPRSTVDRVEDRIQYLMETLRDNREVAIIPAPVLSEFLVFAGKAAPDYLSKIRESSFLRIEPFDERAAIELADREISARAKGNKRGSAPTSDWQKVKFDRQIVAIALVHKASTIYSDDPDIAAHGKDCGVNVLALADLPLPPSRQMKLEEALIEEVTITGPAVAPPAPISGSIAGSTPSEAGVAPTEETDAKVEVAAAPQGEVVPKTEPPADDKPAGES
jgi:PIN domain